MPLITFEGIDGTGKSTQVKLTSQFLEKLSLPHHCTREPGATPLGVKCRELILEDTDISDEARFMLLMADRAEHINKVLTPRIANGEFILCDRYYDSSIAYQGYGQGLNISMIKAAHLVMKAPIPAVTILLDAPVEFIAERLEGNFFENRTDILERSRQGFLFEAKPKKVEGSALPEINDRWHVVDATQSIHHIQTSIREILFNKFKDVETATEKLGAEV